MKLSVKLSLMAGFLMALTIALGLFSLVQMSKINDGSTDINHNWLPSTRYALNLNIDMQPVGYDIDTARLIAKSLGVKLKLVPVTSTNRIPYLTTGKVDLVISSLGKNAEREKAIDFSVAYAPFFNGVFGPADLKVAAAEDLAGKTIAVTRGAVEDMDGEGALTAATCGQKHVLAPGGYVFAPAGKGLEFTNTTNAPVRFLLYKQRYIALPGHEAEVVFGNTATMEERIYEDMPR